MIALRIATRLFFSAVSSLSSVMLRATVWTLALLLLTNCGTGAAYALSIRSAVPANGLTVAPSTGAAGSLFTLTATVTVGGAPATGGTVSFYDGKRLLGTSQIIATTSGGGVVGTAVWRTRSLQPGTDSLTAAYAGPSGKSTSAAALVSVTGKLGSVAALTSSGVQGSYALTGTVLGAGIANPNGNVVFTDNQTGVTLGTVALDPATRLQGFVTASTPTFGSNSSPRYSALGDLNGDGIPDIVENVSSALQILIGKGNGTFQAPVAAQQVYVSGGPILGDFNGDGKLDIAVGSANSVALLLGNGDGTFAAPVSYTTASDRNSSTRSLVEGDFDGDGKLDIVATNTCCSNVSVLIGNGDGTLKPYTTFAAQGSFAAMERADFNGDGSLDLVVADEGDQTLSIFFGKGDGTFQAQTPFSVVNPRTNFSIGLSVGDLNGDGSPDIVAFNAYYPYTIGIFINSGTGTFTPQSFAASPVNNFVGLGDTNGDGKLDLLCFSYGNSSYFVSIFAGNGDGTFSSNAVSYPVGSGAGSLFLTDLDGDGKSDLLTSNQNDGTLSVLLNTVSQSATLTGVTLGGLTADKVTATYQGDSFYASNTSNSLTLPSNPAVGQTKLTVSPASGALGTVFTLTATSVDPGGNAVNTGSVTFNDGTSPLATVEIARSTGIATFKTSSLALGAHSLQAVYAGNTSYKGGSSAVETVQVTGKNPTATLLGATGAQGSYQLMAGVEGFGIGTPSGSVTFTDTTAGKTLGTVPLSAATASSGFLLPVNYGLDAYPSQVVPVDINNDGKLDIVIAGANKGQFSVALGNGDGTFAPKKTYGDNTYNAHTVVVADFNGDGKLDVLTQGANVTLFLGNGDGTFQSTALQIYSAPYQISVDSIGIGDVNGDGKLDILISTDDGGTTTPATRHKELVLLGNVDGTFASPFSYATPDNCNGLCSVADMDGDGKLDIVIPTYGSVNDTVSILKGNGDGTFAPVQNIPNFAVPASLYAAVVADINHDGRPDLVVNGYTSGTFLVALNQGGGNFAAPVAYTATGFTFSQLTVADVTGDGIPDVIAAGNTGSVAVFAGKGDGTFGAASYYATNYTGDGVTWVAAGDFNGDGRADLAAATANNNYPGLSVLIGESSNLVTLSNVNLTGSGLDNVQASYNGDTQFATSASNTIALPANPLATSTTLLATPGTAAPGSLVTLTATVKSGASTPVTAGSVTFYVGTKALGTVPVTAQTGPGVTPGTSTLNTRALRRGTDSITAKFTGPNWLIGSTSAAQTVTVTGAASSATATTLGVTGTAGNYTLSATVSGYGAVPPTGTVNFTDTTANKLLGTATISAGARGFTLNPSAIPDNLGIQAEPIVSADLNGDSNLDAATCGYGSSTVLISFGNGDGTFKPVKSIPTGYCYSLDIGDMNGDGKPDLFVVGYQSFSVALGNGDGTFAAPTIFNDGTFIDRTVKLADLNGDGKLDAIVSSDYQSSGHSVRIFYGNGDGTFWTSLFFPLNDYVSAIAVGDFNGDGRPDAAVLCDTLGNSKILLGGLGGSFQVKPLDFMLTGVSSVEGQDMKTADLNGDGKLDLVVVGLRGVYVLIGKGDGTFVTPPLYYSNVLGNSLSVADIDGDGKLDLVSTGDGQYGGQIDVLLGKGDGTFGPAQNLSNFQGNSYAAVGDFNNDGRPDILAPYVTNIYYSQPYKYTLFLNQGNNTATLTGVSALGSGLHNVVATYLGDAIYTGSTSAPQQVTAVAASPTLTLTPQPSTSPAFGTAVSVLAALSGGQGAPVPTGTLSYTVDGGAAQVATLTKGSVTLALGNTLAVGPHSLAVTYSGDTIYAGTSQTLALIVTKAAQTINFPPVGNNIYGSGTFGAYASSSSGLPVTLKVISGPATVAPASTNLTAVTVFAAGTVVLEADQAGNGSYTAAPPVHQTFTFTKAPLAVTVGNATKVYGAANPAFASTVTGLIGTDAVTVNYSTAATTASGYGSYAISATISGAAAANYASTVTPGTLTVTKALLTVTVDNVTRLYGAANPAFSGTISGLQGADTASATYSSTATTATGVGSAYPITATVSGGNLGNYTLNVVPGKLAIDPAPLTITVANAGKVYGTANPAFTSTLSGVLNGDSVPVTYGTAATSASSVGSYAITASTTASNYVATVLPGSLTVTPAPLTVLVNSFTKVYGTANPVLTGSVTGLLFSDTVTPTYSAAAFSSSSVGSYAITASISGGASANYKANVTPGTLTVAKAALTATAVNVSRQYGIANPALTYKLSGFTNSDTAAKVGGAATLATTAGLTSPSGTYPITFTTEGLTAANYTFTYVSGTLTVLGGVSQSITFGPLGSATYGASPITLSATASSGLPVSYTVTGPATLSGSTLTIRGAGTITVIASQAGNADYLAATTVSQTLLITKAGLIVTATNLSRQYGSANPALTFSVSGFVAGDLSSVVSGTATLSTTATANSPTGSYPISFATEGLTASNYTFTYVPGTLTISGGKAQTITFGALSNRTYGAPSFALTATASSGLPVSYTVAGPAKLSGATITITGAGQVAVTAVQAGDPNYAAAPSVSQSFTVSKALLTVTAPNLSRPFAAVNPALSSTLTGFVNGDTTAIVSGTATLITTATLTSPVGTYPINFATEALAAINYSFNYLSGTLTVGSSTQSISFGALSNVTYGTGPLTLSAAASSGLPVGYAVSGPATLSALALTITGAGLVTVTASQPGNANYTAATPVLQSFTVAKAPLTVTASSFSRQYGAANPALTYAITGFVSSDNAPVVTGTATLSTTATSTSPLGLYPITFATEQLTATNYTFTYVPGTLTVSGGVAQSITFRALPNLIYGVASITLNATANSGLPVTYTVTGPVTLTGSTLSINGAGSVTVTASQSGNATYAPATPVVRTFTVSKAELTVTAVNLTRTYATQNPPLTYTVTGFLDTDTASIISGTASLTTAAAATSPVGSYPITFATEALTAANYSFVYVSGTLSIQSLPSQIITFPAIANRTYGASPINLAATASSGLPISYTVIGPAALAGSTLTITGAGTITVTATQAGNTTYSAAPPISQSFQVAKAVLTVTAASVSRQFGAPNPALTYTVTGFLRGDTSLVVSGTATLSTTATITSQAGTYPVTFASEGLAAANYSLTYISGVLTVTPLAVVAAPAFTPAGGSFTAPQTVMLSDVSTGVAIHYTLDGSMPTVNSPLYTAAIQVDSTKTINAIAILNGISSAASSQTYAINLGRCQTVDYSKGIAANGLSLNGGATVNGNALQLTDDGRFEARSAFYATALPVSAYTADFTFQILNPVADGMAFVIQSVSPNALGQSGGGLGYAGIQKSMAFKLDLHNNFGEGFDSTGMYLNGTYPSIPSIDLGPTRIDLHSGHIFAVHLVYANGSTAGKITDTVTGVSASGNFPGNITQAVGDSAYVGFTAGTGNSSSAAKILTWSFSGGTGCPAK